MFIKTLLAGLTIAVIATSNAYAANGHFIKTTGEKNTLTPIYVSKNQDLRKADSGAFKVAGINDDNGYATAFTECSNIAEKQAEGNSDAVYLNYFYGCMRQRGYSN